METDSLRADSEPCDSCAMMRESSRRICATGHQGVPRAVKVAVVYESRTGNTAHVAEMIGAAVQELGHEVGIWPTEKANLDYLTDADMVFLGTWTGGIIVTGHHPGDGGKLLAMPGIWGKPTAGFMTYALHAGKVLDKMSDIVTLLGGVWLGGRLFKRGKLDEGLASFVVAALDAAEASLGVAS